MTRCSCARWPGALRADRRRAAAVRLQIVIIGQAAEVQRTNAFASVANLMPAFLQRGLGNKAMLLATFKGTVAFGYFHPVVCLLVARGDVPRDRGGARSRVRTRRSRAGATVPRHRLLTRSLRARARGGRRRVAADGRRDVARRCAIFDAGGLDLPSPRCALELLVTCSRSAACFSAFGLLVASCVTPLGDGLHRRRADVGRRLHHRLPRARVGAERRTSRGCRRFTTTRRCRSSPATPPRRATWSILFSVSAAMIAAAYWQFQRRDL